MTELDLLLIRQREHEIAAAELLIRKGVMERRRSAIEDAHTKLEELEKSTTSHVRRLEQSGIDYLTITAEMARIRAEVRGEKRWVAK